MKKTLALAAAMALVAAAAMARPNDNDKTSASAASATTAGGTCSMSSADCAKMHCDKASGASAMKMMKMEHTTFSVAGLKGQRDARKIQAGLASMKGVNDVSCDFENGTATVCRVGSCTSASVAQKLSSLGYHATVVTADMKAGGGSCPYAKGAAAGACPHGKTSGASASNSSTKDKTL